MIRIRQLATLNIPSTQLHLRGGDSIQLARTKSNHHKGGRGDTKQILDSHGDLNLNMNE